MSGFIIWFKEFFSETPTTPVQAQPKLVKKLIHTDKSFDVGVTTMAITFDDGREVHAKIYGNVNQFIYYYEPLKVLEPYVITSVDKYKSFLSSFNPSDHVKIVDDENNPTTAWTGRIANLEIYKTEPHEICYGVASVIEVADDSL